jgi:hypothetical protein
MRHLLVRGGVTWSQEFIPNAAQLGNMEAKSGLRIIVREQIYQVGVQDVCVESKVAMARVMDRLKL